MTNQASAPGGAPEPVMGVVGRASELRPLPALGAGLGFRPEFRGELFRNRSGVDFLEITADHYFDSGPEKQAELDLLRRHFTLIPHGLNLSLGSAEGIDAGYLERFAGLVEQLNPPWWSEHICFTQAGGMDIGHLAPLPFSRAAVEALRRNVGRARERIRTPLILENISYVAQPPGSEMDEVEFLIRVLDATGCGLLLDVTNLYTNAVNHGFDPYAALRRMPLERIVQLHFAGGFTEDGLLIDSHSRPTPEAVWELLDEVLRSAPVKGAILERDEHIPPLAELLPEVERVRRMGAAHGRW